MAKFKLEDGSEVEAFTAEELAEKISTETAGLKAKIDQLMDENKPLQRRTKELEELAKTAEEERLKEKEEFKTLWEREQKAKAELSEKYEDFQKRIQKKDIDSESFTIAAQLTRDNKRAALLQEQIARHAKYTEDGVHFELGGVKVDKAKIVETITESYPFLVDGSQASGGGANGSQGGGAAGKKTATRSEFDAMSHPQRAEFAKSGGNVIDE